MRAAVVPSSSSSSSSSPWWRWFGQQQQQQQRRGGGERPTRAGDRLVLLLVLVGATLLLASVLRLAAPRGGEEVQPERRSASPAERAADALRIMCMVPTHPDQVDKMRTILDTWGAWCDGLVFTVDPRTYSEPGGEAAGGENGIAIPVQEPTGLVRSSDGTVSGLVVYLSQLVRKRGNDCFTGTTAVNPETGRREPIFTPCRHIWEKVWRSWVWVGDHLLHQYDYFFKVDDDTYFFVPWMRQVIVQRGWSPEDMHYFGQKVYPIGPRNPLIAGALVGFSRALLAKLFVKYKAMDHEYGDRRNFQHGRCVDRDGATEEVTTSICIRELGVEPEELYDSSRLPRRPHMHLWLPRNMFEFSRRDNSSSWFYKHAPRDVGTLENCCSDNPVGYHFLRHDSDLQRIHDLIVDPKNERELEKALEVKIPQWKVRAAEGKVAHSIFDGQPFAARTCILELEYFARVKENWRKKTPLETRRHLNL